jgi:UDP-N-acetylglucosamine transferase subunit ALG13
MLDPADIPALMARARIVVGHAGPGTVLDARRAGRLPVIVPRLARFGEVVDDHQVTFGRWMDGRSLACCAEDEPAVRHHLDAALDDAGPYEVAIDGSAPPPAVTLFGDLVDGLLTR